MIDSMNELYKELESNTISKEVLDIFKELDTTASLTTQASLNEMLVGLYNRIKKEDISIDTIGDRVTPDEVRRWIKENITEYSKELFFESIGIKDA